MPTKRSNSPAKFSWPLVAGFALLLCEPDVSNAKKVDAGATHSCMVTPSGGARCWGDNTYGELGDGTLQSSASPVDVNGLAGVVDIAAGGYFSCALMDSGGVKCWGYNGNSEVDATPAIQVPTPTLIKGLETEVRAISAGSDHACALTAAGGVRCWGYNDVGQLGNGSHVASAVPVAVIGLESGVSAIATGVKSTCALTVGGAVKCWGWNESGEVGDGTAEDRSAPVGVTGLGSGVAAIAAGYGHACAVTTRGQLKCWGGNGAGELGTGVATSAMPIPVDANAVSGTVRSVAIGHGYTCAVVAGAGVRCWGYGLGGELGNGWTNSTTQPVDVVGLRSDVAELAGGLMGHACVLRATGEILCWGDGRQGQLGSAIPSQRNSPVAVVAASSGVAAIASGDHHACALLEDASLQCWGGNTSGELGNGSRRSSPSPTNTLAVGVGIAVVATGGSHTCAAAADGRVFCWGLNVFGEIGGGSSDTQPSPLVIGGLRDVVSVTGGDIHSCALTRSGAVKCWGDNGVGQLGAGTQGDSHLAPSTVPSLGSGVVSIAAGSYHTCAVTADGGVKCWGQNALGALGDGTPTNRLVPTSTASLGGEAIAVSASDMHSCALLRDGRVSCWGAEKLAPELVDGIVDASAIAVGAGHACAITRSGNLECWGRNWAGQLGNGTNTDQRWPVIVDMGGSARAVSAGTDFTCAVRTDGIAKCWGSNASGQLGNGEAGYSAVPVTVAGTFAGHVFRGGHAQHEQPAPILSPTTPTTRRPTLR